MNCKSSFSIGLAVLCNLACGYAVAAGPVNISGTWTTQTEVQGVAVNETCHIQQAADSKLSGTCETSSGIFKLTGTVNGVAVSFTHPATYGGEDSTVSFFGKLDDEVSISGSLDLQPLNAGGSFAMKKQIAK